MAPPRRPAPEPLQANEFTPVLVGIALWLVAFVVLLVLHHHMAANGKGWWLWVAVSGVVLGLWGLVLLSLRRRSLRRRATRQPPSTG